MASKQIVDDGVNRNTKSNVSSGKKVLHRVVVIKHTVGVLVHLVEEGDLWSEEGRKRERGKAGERDRRGEGGWEGRKRGDREGKRRVGREEGRITKKEEKEEGVVVASFHIHANSGK